MFSPNKASTMVFFYTRCGELVGLESIKLMDVKQTKIEWSHVFRAMLYILVL